MMGFLSSIVDVVSASFVITVIAIRSSAYNIDQAGSVERGSAAGVDFPGAAFLAKEAFRRAGVLFGYKAYFRNRNLARFQIWRPVEPKQDSTYRLLLETTYLPSLSNGPAIEDVYLKKVGVESSTCLRVQPNDRFAVYSDAGNSSVSYLFNPDPAFVEAQGHVFSNSSHPAELNSDVSFETIVFPYNFAAAAYIYYGDDVSPGNDMYVECRIAYLPYKGTRPKPTPSPPIKGVEGDTGPQGPLGDTGATGPVGFTGLMGPTGWTGSTGDIGATGATGATGASGLPGPVGYTGSTGSKGAPGLPGLIGATGGTGPQGDTGPSGLFIYENKTYEEYPYHLFGDTSTERSQQAVAGESSSDSDETDWTTEKFMIGALVWLAVLTFIIVIFIIILIILTLFYCRRKRDLNRKTNMLKGTPAYDATDNTNIELTRGPNGTAVEADGEPEWVADLPVQSTLIYSPEASTTFGPYAGRQMQASLATYDESSPSKSDEKPDSDSSSPPPYGLTAETTNEEL